MTTNRLTDAELEEIAKLADDYGSFDPVGNGRAYGMARELLAYRRAGVAVKPLEWEGKPSDCFMSADTMLGYYQVHVEYGDEWAGSFEPKGGRSNNVTSWRSTADEAQAKCQEDWETRIRSCLLTPPPASRADADLRAENERLRELVAVLIDPDAGEVDRRLAMKDARAALSTPAPSRPDEEPRHE